MESRNIRSGEGKTKIKPLGRPEKLIRKAVLGMKGICMENVERIATANTVEENILLLEWAGWN